jgi:predicted DsbA family dithiol-disulfide isomerase
MEVEIWSDVVCPWCYIGKRRFEAALAQFEHADEVTVTWRSFELDPQAPAETVGDRARRLADKYGLTLDRAREMEHNVTAAAAAEGLDYHLDIARSANTFDAHRLIHLAAEHDLGEAMKERLLRAYFTEGRLISDHGTLVELAGEVGLDPAEAQAMLESDRFADAVREDELTAQRFGLTGVPTFVVGRAIAVSGAQPSEVLLQLLEQARQNQAPKIVATGGESCDVDGF